jgi:D-sedoheptulose 7-phosphate isomerase
MSHAQQFLSEAKQLIDGLNVEIIERMAAILEEARDRGGRSFILGIGGNAANASHAVNDFRKIVGIEAYAPTDNVSELTLALMTRVGLLFLWRGYESAG